MQYLPFFLEDVPGETCPKGGHAAYGQAVKIETTDKNEVRHLKVYQFYICFYFLLIHHKMKRDINKC